MSREGTNICAGSELLVTTGSTDETIELGRRLGRLLEPGDVVALAGPLGAGKTYLTKGIALGLGVSDIRAVRSPTFILVSEYEARVRLYHVDAYRLSGPAAMEALGSDDFMFAGGVTVVEWADRVKGALPAEHLWVECGHVAEDRRSFRFVARGERAETLVKNLTAGE